MKHSLTLFLSLLFGEICFAQNRDKISYLIIDKTEISPQFTDKINDAMNDLNNRQNETLGKFFYPPDQGAVRTFYLQSQYANLKDKYCRGSYLLCFEISDFQKSSFSDEKILTVTAVNLTAPHPLPLVVMRKNVVLDDLKTLIKTTVKCHILDICSGVRRTKPSLLVYDDGQHLDCNEHIEFYRSLFYDTVLLKRFFIEKTEQAKMNGTTVRSIKLPDNSFIYSINGTSRKIEIICGRPIRPTNLSNFRKYLTEQYGQ